MLDMTVIYDLAIVALRILMPVYAIIIVYQCICCNASSQKARKASCYTLQYSYRT